MSLKREYDAAIGGDVVLESHVQTYRYASGAIQEIRSLLAATKKPTGTKLIFQTLPKHIRRRAMSHHPKRLPIKYRSIHIAQMAKSGKQKLMRRPSRKYRRRPNNLLQDYLRRQRKNIWLETHIWHAKRFHMIDRWGYRLPLKSCDKTFRACYRATAEHCLLQDISFYNCIELHGKVESIFAGLKRMTCDCLTTCNRLTIKALTYLSGKREGSIDLYRKDQWPEAALCRATFMWRPTDAENFADENLVRTLWFWVHPCVYSTIIEDLISVFQLEKAEEENEVEKKEEQIQIEDIGLDEHKRPASKIDEQRLQFMTKNSAHERIKKYTNSKGEIRLTDLKDTLNRFRLTGPLSQSVLLHAFRPKELPCNVNEEDSIDWFQYSSLEENFREQHIDQVGYWKQCKIINTPALVVPNMILGLNIVDPRLQRPSKRTKATDESFENGENVNHLDFYKLLVDLPEGLPQSPLWDENVRTKLRFKMLDTKSWCQQREQHALVPGAPCAFEDGMQPIPVILIQRPGLQDSHKRLNYGCGWDVIAPAGYAMTIWMTLIMWGAKPGGLRELHSLAREMGTEVHLPDTIGGRQQAADKYAIASAKYFRLPPGKRSNYRKLSIISPFRPPWIQLIRDWLSRNGNGNGEELMEPENFYVERDKTQLQYLDELAFQLKPFPDGDPHNTVRLIQLQLRLKSRGNIRNNALICLPTRTDIMRHYKNILRKIHSPVHTEPLQPDLNENERKIARLEHKKHLKRLRAKRVREKRGLQETSRTHVRIREANTTSIVRKQFERMCALWLPNEDCSTYLSVRKQCSRETIGYVTDGNFSFTQATVCAVGYVTSEGLMKLLKLFISDKRGEPMCLLRDTNSRHYYFATFEISQNP